METTSPSDKTPFGVRLRAAVKGKPRRILLAVIAGLILLGTAGAGLLYATMTAGLPDLAKLDRYDPARTTKIFSADGTLIATLFDENRTYTKIEKISPLMLASLVAIEDQRFYEHQGVDWKGIVRALGGNFTAGGTEQGASTLTMQLTRKLFLTQERTYARKVREAVLASRIDKKLSKEKILELYLNEVYFGAGAYGIDSAASVYFGRDPDKLELWQAAMLAGLVQAPSSFSPLVDKKAALLRLDAVLDALESQGKITSKLGLEARKEAAAYSFVDRPLPSSDGMLKYPYFTTYVIRRLSETYPENYVRRGGLQVVTTLDLRLQKKAEEAVKNSIQGPGKAMGADTGAVVMLDNRTGDVVAMVGGPGWNSKKQFNAAWQARRQPGSAFKMFVYAAGLEAGYSPEQEFADTKATFFPGSPEQWEPKNSDGSFMGAIPLRTGLQFSRNLVAAKLVAHVGPSRIVALAHRMGVEGDLPEVASLALGAGEVSPLQMARAFSVLPSGGVLRPTHVIKRVTTADGKVLKDSSEENEVDRVLSKETARLMCEMLHRVVTGGTAPAANLPSTYVAGKTGTTDNFKDAWFCGFTPFHTVAVWVGRDDNKPMARVYGGTLPAEIFRTVAGAGLEGRDPTNQLPGVRFGEAQSVKLCWDSTYLATANCGKTYQEVFKAGVLPTRQCPVHRQVDLPPTVAMRPGGSASPNAPLSAPVSVTLSEKDLPDRLNPRKDQEVVSPMGAQIPYTEEAPSLQKVKFRILEGLTVSPDSSASPGELLPGDDLVESQEGVVESSGDLPSIEQQQPTRDISPEGASSSGEGDPALTVPGASTPSSQSVNEVIHQPKVNLPGSEQPEIPPDPVSD